MTVFVPDRGLSALLFCAVISVVSVVYCECPHGDLNGDCRIDLEDLGILARHWMTQNPDGVRQYIRVDRVNYDDNNGWPTEADGNGSSLGRINDESYGNDIANWNDASPTPRGTNDAIQQTLLSHP